MKLEWMGEYRDIVGDFYRSANGYSQVCKDEVFGESVKFSPYEVQIMEHIMEYSDDHKNMKWYASRLGLSQPTYTKYVQKLVNKGLVSKYHSSDNRKDIILKVSPLGIREYEKYSIYSNEHWFSALFRVLDSFTPEQLDAVRQVSEIWGGFHGEKSPGINTPEPSLIKIE